MPAKATTSISDDAVKAKTGKIWREWFSLLDKAGARTLDHKGIVAILSEQYSVGPWWQQMVTVEYERARGLREKHETAAGFVAEVYEGLNAVLPLPEIGIELPLAEIYEAVAFHPEPEDADE